jgi:MtaA/CmuA family methyltransferase
MNSLERVQRRLAGQTVDRPPNFDIMMTFAAHYIGQPLSRYYQGYRVLVDANLAVMEAFGLDIVQAISDPYREASSFGAAIEFPPDDLPLCRVPPLIDPGDISRLKTPTPLEGRMGDRVRAIEEFRRQVGGETPIMGWVEGALAEAADLRGVSTLLLDLIDRPGWVSGLLEICCENAVAFALAQVSAGADIIGLGDAVASQISPKFYERFGLPYEQRIFSAVHTAGAKTRLHICGNTTRLLPLMAHAGADIVDIDWMVDMQRAADVLGEITPLCGNFDPVAVMLQGTPDMVARATADCLRRGGPRTISGAGCEIPDGTPAENLRAQAKALSSFRG